MSYGKSEEAVVGTKVNLDTGEVWVNARDMLLAHYKFTAKGLTPDTTDFLERIVERGKKEAKGY